MSKSTLELEHMVRVLEQTGDFRILRKLQSRPHCRPVDGINTKTGVFLDVETTGLDYARSEVIELAMVPFEFSADGRIFSVGEPLQQFNEPLESIPAEITALTGITDDLVMGSRLDSAKIKSMADAAVLVIAHNAAFDRPFAERISSVFREKPWACSMCGIPWKSEGIEGRRLVDLLARYGLFFDNHRASDDCRAAIELLTMKLPKSGELAMAKLLEQARVATYRISAEGAPFASKEALKARGYRWNTEEGVGPRAWWIEVLADQVESELTFLERNVFYGQTHIPIRKITAIERYSADASLR